MQAAWKRFCRHRINLIAILVSHRAGHAVCLIGPSLSPYAQDAQDLELKATNISPQHWLGTDTLGP
jgi:peptide/nickel transport system permease protein